MGFALRRCVIVGCVDWWGLAKRGEKAVIEGEGGGDELLGVWTDALAVELSVKECFGDKSVEAGGILLVYLVEETACFFECRIEICFIHVGV